LSRGQPKSAIAALCLSLWIKTNGQHDSVGLRGQFLCVGVDDAVARHDSQTQAWRGATSVPEVFQNDLVRTSCE
jgi:hypothetical protein